MGLSRSLALQARDRSLALVHLELVADAAHAADAGDAGNEIVDFVLENRTGEDHVAALDPYLDGPRMPDRPANLRPHPLRQDVVGDRLFVHARRELVR